MLVPRKEEKPLNGMIKRDITSLVSLLHEDFLYLEDTSLQTCEEWIESVNKIHSERELDYSKIELSERFETKDMGAYEYLSVIRGQMMRTLNSFIYKEDKLYRHMITRIPVD